MFQKSKFKPCENCQQPVFPKEINCPYCGSPIKKDFLPKIVIGLLLLILLSTLAIPTKGKLEKERKRIVSVGAATVDVSNWAKNKNKKAMLDKIGELEGKIVELHLQVFVATYLSDYFGIVTVPSDGIPGTYLMLYPKDGTETAFLKNIKAGQTIKIRGKVNGTYLKRIKIEPAFLI